MKNNWHRKGSFVYLILDMVLLKQELYFKARLSINIHTIPIHQSQDVYPPWLNQQQQVGGRSFSLYVSSKVLNRWPLMFEIHCHWSMLHTAPLLLEIVQQPILRLQQTYGYTRAFRCLCLHHKPGFNGKGSAAALLSAMTCFGLCQVGIWLK